MLVQNPKKFRRLLKSHRQSLLSPTLIQALTELAAIEGLPVPTLIALLINEALSVRLRRCRS